MEKVFTNLTTGGPISVYVEDGKITAVGDYTTLYESCPEFKTLVDLQKLEEEGGEKHA